MLNSFSTFGLTVEVSCGATIGWTVLEFFQLLLNDFAKLICSLPVHGPYSVIIVWPIKPLIPIVSHAFATESAKK